MALISILRPIPAVEHSPGRIEVGPKRAAENAIDETCSVSRSFLFRGKPTEFGNEFFAQLVIGVERQDPLARNLRQAEIALRCEIVERATHDFGLRVAKNHLYGFIGAAAI